MTMKANETKMENEKELLNLMARVFQRMRDRAIELRRLSNVQAVAIQFQPMFDDPPIIEGYVDVILKDGNVVTWFVDVRWSIHDWQIETWFEEKFTDGESIEDDRSIITIVVFDDFASALDLAVETLLKRMPMRASFVLPV